MSQAAAAAIEKVLEPPLQTPGPKPPEIPVVTPSVSPQVGPPRFAAFAAVRASSAEKVRAVLNIEEVLGTNWLNKLGVIILVLGVAFFLAYQLQTLGPAGKVLVGYVVSPDFSPRI